MVDDSRRLGYGGSAEIEGTQVLITGGTFDSVGTISYLNMQDIIPAEVSRSRVKHADGTEAFTGSISFDVTNALISSNLFSTTKLFKRRYLVSNVGINDGERQYEMQNCYVSTLTIAGAPGGLINASLAFAATRGKVVASVDNDYILDAPYTVSTNQPMGYWWSGASSTGGPSIVRDWTFTFNQDVIPMYGNENTIFPRYLKVGLIFYSLQVNLYVESAPNKVYISTKSFTLVGDTTSEVYTYNGPSDFGTFSHTFETSARAAIGSGDSIIS